MQRAPSSNRRRRVTSQESPLSRDILELTRMEQVPGASRPDRTPHLERGTPIRSKTNPFSVVRGKGSPEHSPTGGFLGPESVLERPALWDGHRPPTAHKRGGRFGTAHSGAPSLGVDRQCGHATPPCSYGTDTVLNLTVRVNRRDGVPGWVPWRSTSVPASIIERSVLSRSEPCGAELAPSGCGS